jgi:anti-sigma factor RsiW
MTLPDAPTESLLHAYVDGQLDDAGRFEVELFLRGDAGRAADALADMSNNKALRLLAGALSDAPACAATGGGAETLAAARRLEGALARRAFAGPLRLVAAMIAIFAMGWALGVGWSALRSPDQNRQYVAAPQSTSLLAADATLAVADPDPAGRQVDPEKIGRALQLALPRIPEGWRLAELHILPGRDGPAVQLIFDAPRFGRLALFAGGSDRIGISFPTIDRSNGKTAALWHLVSSQYILTGHLSSKPLELAALELYQTLY